MLVVDFHTLKPVNSLNLLDHIILHCTDTLDLQDIMRIHTTFGQTISGFQYLSIHNTNSGSVRNKISLRISRFHIRHSNLSFFLGVTDAYHTWNLCDDRKTLRLPSFKKLFDTRKTLCNITAGHTACMECTHGQLCTRLTDRLGCNNPYRFTYLYRFAGSHIRSVTLRADTYFAAASQNSTDFHFLNGSACLADTFTHDTGSTLRCNHMVRLNQNFSVFIADCLTGISSGDTFLKTFNFFFSIHESAHIHTWNLVFLAAAIRFTDNQFLRHVNQTSGQITRVSCTQSRIRQTLTGSMGRHKVFQYVQTFTEIGLDRQLNGVTGGICHQSTHTCQLFDLLIRTTRSGICHHIDIVIFIQT